MQYLALLGGDEAASPQPGTSEFDVMMEGYARFGEAAANAIVGGEALQPAVTATTVRSGATEPLVTSGPFAETVEALGGYYVLDADTLDDAIELARQIPAVNDGWVALRPMVMWFDNGAGAPGSDDEPRYVAFIYGKETDGDQPGTPAWDEGTAAHQRFIDAAGAAVQAGGAVHPVATTTTVRVRDGEVIVTDGPFTESAEVVGGFYLLRSASPDAAVALAGQIPSEAIELRPIWEIG